MKKKFVAIALSSLFITGCDDSTVADKSLVLDKKSNEPVLNSSINEPWQQDCTVFANSVSQSTIKAVRENGFIDSYVFRDKMIDWKLRLVKTVLDKDGKLELIFDLKPCGPNASIFAVTTFLADPGSEAAWKAISPNAIVHFNGWIKSIGLRTMVARIPNMEVKDPINADAMITVENVKIVS